jgi:hypothetical protein
MRYSDVKKDLDTVTVEITDSDLGIKLLRILHAIAGELDSISYRLRKTKRKGGHRGKQVRA